MKRVDQVMSNNRNMGAWEVQDFQDAFNLNLNDEGEHAFDIDPISEIELAMSEVDESWFELAAPVGRMACRSCGNKVHHSLKCTNQKGVK